MTLNLVNTALALRDYDRDAPAREKLWKDAETDEDIFEWRYQEKDASDDVRRAFWADTKDRNSYDSCMVVGISYIRELLKKYPVP